MRKKCDRNTVLQLACLEGVTKLKEVLACVGDYVDINESGVRGYTILHMACFRNDPEMVKVILDYGKDKLDINKVNDDHWNALHIACNKGYPEIVKLILERDDVDINAVDKGGDTALHMVRNKEIAELLLAYPHMKVDVNIKDKEGSTPFKIACTLGDMDLINALLYYPNTKILINEPDDKGFTAAHMACGRGNLEMLESIMAYPHVKLDLGVVSKDGITLLHAAASAENLDIVNILVNSKDIDLNKITKRGVTALHIATTKSNTGIVRAIISSERGRECINITNKGKVTPLQVACKKGDRAIVKMLLEALADVNITNTDGYSAMHVACEEGYKSIIELLVANESVNMNLMGKYDDTPLHIACGEESGKMLDLLLKRNDVDVNANRKGLTPLCLACSYGYIDVVERLLAREDVDITIVPNKTGNITKLVKGGNKARIIDMLQERALNEMYEACDKGNFSRVNKLINIVKDISDENLKRLINVSESNIIQLFLNKFGLEKMSKVLMCVSEVSRGRMVEVMLGVRDVLKKVSGDVLALMESKVLEKVAIARANGDDRYIRCISETGIDMTKIAKENKESSKVPSIPVDEIREEDILVAVKKEDIKRVKKLLKKIKNLDVRDEHGKNALMIAVERRNINIVKAILEKNIDIDAKDNRGKSALMIAIENNYSDVAEILVDRGANVNERDNNNRTVLMYALRCGESMSFIIDNLMYAGVSMKDNGGVTLLMHACVGGYMKAIEKAIEMGVDVHATDANGRTAVGMVYSKNNMQLAEYLMKKGAVSPGNMPRDKKNKFRELVHKVSMEDKLCYDKGLPERKEERNIEPVAISNRRNKKKSKGKSRCK